MQTQVVSNSSLLSDFSKRWYNEEEQQCAFVTYGDYDMWRDVAGMYKSKVLEACLGAVHCDDEILHVTMSEACMEA